MTTNPTANIFNQPKLIVPDYHADGILYIGDPHASSRKPGGRKDEDFAFVSTDKLTQAFLIANKHNLVPVITGDLLNRSRGDDERLYTLLMRAFKVAKHLPIVLLGNHDVHDENEESLITDDTTLAIFIEACAFVSIEKAGQRVRIIGENKDGKHNHDIVFYPFGSGIPKSIERDEDCHSLSIVSHHDMAFDGAYPGAMELFPIDGCDLVVNGHMHLTKPPILQDKTLFWNIGNITRLSRDTTNHVPAVWMQKFSQATPEKPLVSIPLQYVKDVFNLFVPADKSGTSVVAVSSFVELMREQSALDSEKTEDGSGLKAEMIAVQGELKTSKEAGVILDALIGMELVG
jgi:hypothetical protein